jgi:hypothetical protein
MLANPRGSEKRTFLDQVGHGGTPERSISKRPHSKAFEAARPFSQEGLMLEVCFKSGGCRFFDSAGCMEAAYEQGDTILALYATAVLHIEGRNLGELASLIKERRAEYVQEQHDEDVGETEPHIDAITLHSPDNWGELVLELEREGRISAKATERSEGHA